MPDSIFLPDFYHYFLISTIVYCFTYVVGRVICLPFQESISYNIESVFFTLFIGFVTIVSVFAIICTKGDTIFLLSIFIAIFFLSFRKDNSKTYFKKINPLTLIELYHIVGVFLLFSGVFAASYYLFFLRCNGEVYSDFIFYANVSNALAINHIECISWFQSINTPAMYHYGELWFNSFWATTFNLNHLYTLILITHVYLFSLILLGSFSITQKYFKKNYCIIVIIAITFVIYNPIATFFVSYQYQIISRPKYFVTVLFLIFALLQYLQNEKFNTFVVLLLLIVFNNVVASGILSALFFTTIVLHLIQNEFNRPYIFNKYTISCIFVLLFFVTFYGFRNQTTSLTSGNSAPNISLTYTEEYIFRGIMYGVIRLFPISIILFVVNYYNSKIREQSYIYWSMVLFGFIGIIFSAILAGLISNYVQDAGQISIIFNSIIVAFITFNILLYLLSKLKLLISMVVISGLLIINLNIINKDIFVKSNLNKDEIIFYKKLKTEFDKNRDLNFGYVRNYNLKWNMNTQSTRMRQIIPLIKIAHIIPSGYYAPHCLSVFDIPNSVQPQYDERQQSELWKYVKITKQSTKFKSISSSIFDFIKEHKINYIIVEKNANIPSYLLSAEVLGEFNGDKILKVKQP